MHPEGHVPIRYTLGRPLGRGGQAEVWEAVLHGPGGFEKPVALKMLRAASVSRDRDALLREARIGARLHHPNVVAVFAVDPVDDGWRVAMELVRGATVHQLLSEGPLPPPVVLDIGLQATAALVHVHEADAHRPLVHRDVKPQNLLVDRHGAVKLADFGIAVAVGERADVVGTAGYAPPEQLAGRPEPRSDQYALGMTLAACALGRRPAGPPGVLQVSEVRLASIVRDVEAAVPGLGDIVERCLQPTPEARFPTSRALHAALLAARAKHPPTPSLQEVLHRARPELGVEPSDPRPSASSVTVPLVRSNLPPARDPFLGRASEREALRGLVGQHRLVTLLGPGGAGKTRLALETAREVDLVGGTWFVDLSEVTSVDGACFALARTFGLVLTPEAPDRQLGAALRARGRLLLVLDNLEQCVETVAPLVGTWLDLAPELSVLGTSRVALDLRGEQRSWLGPLPEDEAVALFVARSGVRGQDAEVTGLVAMLEGSPLAIELAAARAATVPIPRLRERLREGLKVLSGARRDLPARQRSVWASLQWSWDLLAPWARAAIAQLTVCDGGFDSRAAEAILDLSPWPEVGWSLDVLQELVQASLLVVDRTGRFTMLVSVREFAATHLPPDDRAGAERRHARWYAQLAEGPAAPAELDNLVTACRRAMLLGEGGVAVGCALAAWAVLSRRGPFAAGTRLLEPVVAAADPADPRHVALVEAAAAALHATGRSRDAEALLTRSLASRPGVGAWHLGLSELLCNLGQLDDAEEHALAARAAYAATGDRIGLARARLRRSVVQGDRGRPQAAREGLPEVIREFEAAGLQRDLAMAEGLLGTVEGQRSEPREAERWLLRALDRFAAHDEPQGVTAATVSLASLAANRGDYDQAAVFLARALEVHRGTGDRLREGIVLGTWGVVDVVADRAAEGRRRLEQALVLHREAGARTWEAWDLWSLARVGYALCRLADALEHGLDAQELIQGTGDELLHAQIALTLGEVTQGMGRLDAAEQHLRDAHDRYGRLDRADGVAWTEVRRGRLAWARGDLAAAEAAVRPKLPALPPHRTASARVLLARIVAGRDEAEALAHLAAAEAAVRGTHRRCALAEVLATRAALVARAQREVARALLAEAESLVRDRPPDLRDALALARAALST